MRRPSGMQPFGPGALCEIFDDAAGHAAGDAERIDDLPGIETKRCTDTGGRAHRAEDRRGVETGLVDGLRHHEAQPAQHLGADGDPGQRHSSVRVVPLAGGEHGRHDHGACMHRSALKSVVEILAMRGRAVDEGGARRIQRAPVSDRSAGAVIVAARQRASDVVLVARGDAQPDHVDQQILAFARGCSRQYVALQCDDLFDKRFGDRNPGQSRSHIGQMRKIFV
ncbi:hypothetical protein [Bradyrhizobium sp. 200]|uniref:hypothetical protein n=1 Tax=Bradyrhizobium sp. 200 TaxID=2782665 RepID=UPI001FFE9879|nr:hypothetical protein [Bradyrhizobium sp. 200]